jgi:CRP/FNR family transcriptional regulator
MRILSRGHALESPVIDNTVKLFPFLQKNSTTVINDFFSSGYKQNFDKGTQIYWEGDACRGIAFLISGDIRVYKTSESGREITLYEIGPGETCILNASCILSNKKYPANAVTISSGEMYILPAKDLKRMISDHESVREYIFSIFSYRLTSVMTLLEEVVFSKMDERLKDYLVEKSEDNILHATHLEIANDLGTAREVISRLLKDFERKGHVKLSRNTIILSSF